VGLSPSGWKPVWLSGRDSGRAGKPTRRFAEVYRMSLPWAPRGRRDGRGGVFGIPGRAMMANLGRNRRNADLAIVRGHVS